MRNLAFTFVFALACLQFSESARGGDSQIPDGLVDTPACRGYYDSLKLERLLTPEKDFFYDSVAQTLAADIKQAFQGLPQELRDRVISEKKLMLNKPQKLALETDLAKYFSQALKNWPSYNFCPTGNTADLVDHTPGYHYTQYGVCKSGDKSSPSLMVQSRVVQFDSSGNLSLGISVGSTRHQNGDGVYYLTEESEDVNSKPVPRPISLIPVSTSGAVSGNVIVKALSGKDRVNVKLQDSAVYKDLLGKGCIAKSYSTRSNSAVQKHVNREPTAPTKDSPNTDASKAQ